MRFLYVAPRFHTNQYVITKSLVDMGHEVAFFAYYAGRTEDYSVIEPYLMRQSLFTRYMTKNIEKRYGANLADSKKNQYFIPRFCDLFKRIKAFRPDIVITRETNITSMYVYLICGLLGIKTVMVYNQIPLNRKKKSGIKKKIKGIVKAILFPRVRITTVRTDNPAKYKHHMDQYDIKKHDYFVPFIEEVKGTERTYRKDGTAGVLSVGKYRDYKNHFLLVDAVSLLNDTSGLRAAIAGQAYNEEEIDYYDRLKAYIKEKGLHDIITLYKNIDYAAMGELYAEYDIFTLTSKKEQASIAVLEAMANGMVAISTDANGTASYINEGKCGYLFKTGDAGDLAAKIEMCIANKDGIEGMGRAAYAHVRENYSFGNYYTALGDILKKEFKVELEAPGRA